MAQTIKGRVVKLGDRVNTDMIAPGRWKAEPMEILREHSMEALEPEFYKKVRRGDILVAGSDFGCGSHREQAVEVMKAMGVSAVTADSFSRLYFRNGIALGLPVIPAAGVSGFAEEGEILEIVLKDDYIVLSNLTAGTSMTVPPVPRIMRRVLAAGGIYGYLRDGAMTEPAPTAASDAYGSKHLPGPEAGRGFPVQ